MADQPENTAWAMAWREARLGSKPFANLTVSFNAAEGREEKQPVAAPGKRARDICVGWVLRHASQKSEAAPEESTFQTHRESSPSSQLQGSSRRELPESFRVYGNSVLTVSLPLLWTPKVHSPHTCGVHLRRSSAQNAAVAAASLRGKAAPSSGLLWPPTAHVFLPSAPL